MGMENFLTKHAGTLLSIGAGMGVLATGLISCELGRTIEREQTNLKSDDKEAQKSAKVRIGLKAGAAIGTIGVALYCIAKGRELSKKEIAALGTALGTQTKLFNEYRKHETPERDREIMADISKESKKKDTPSEWSDCYLEELSDGKVKSYTATEADILAAVCYTMGKFHQDAYVTLGTFYDALRERGIDIPKLPGENGISWEVTDERIDYYGTVNFGFWYGRDYLDDDSEVTRIMFDDDDEMIHEANKKLEMWVESIARK